MDDWQFLSQKERGSKRRKKGKKPSRKTSWKYQLPQRLWYDNNSEEWIIFQHKTLFVGKIFPLNTISKMVCKKKLLVLLCNKKMEQHGPLWSCTLYHVVCRTSCTGQGYLSSVWKLWFSELRNTQNCILSMWKLMQRTSNKVYHHRFHVYGITSCPPNTHSSPSLSYNCVYWQRNADHMGR